MEADDKHVKITPREKIRKYGSWAVVIVLVYEVLKASHHSVFVGFNRPIDLRTIDWETTGFWFFDTVVAGIVTFALIWIAFSFERLEGILELRGNQAEALSNRFDQTGIKLEQLQLNLSDTQAKLQQVARTLGAEGGIIQIRDSPELWEILEKNIDLQSSFMSNLNNLTRVWAELIINEGNNVYSVSRGKNLGLLCWSVAIDTYLKEEIRDIGNRTIATNIGVYLTLIEALVDSVLKANDQNDSRIEIFASANLLPISYFNWREYSPDSKDSGRNATSLSFMDGYRDKIKTWIQRDRRLTFKRLLIVQDDSQIPTHCRIQVNDLLLPTLSDLQNQAGLKILCRKETLEPELLRVEEVATYVSGLDKSFLDLHRNDYAYAIANSFKAKTQISTADLIELDLTEVFIKQLHSEPSDVNALCLVVADEDCANQLLLLPTVYGGAGAEKIKCPDFLAISVDQKVIACIAARLKPNYDTMLLRLITESGDLIKIDEFIKYASSETIRSVLSR